MEQEHKNTAGLEWFGPPERNTLRPLGGVLFLVVYEPILCQALAFTQPGLLLAGAPLL